MQTHLLIPLLVAPFLHPATSSQPAPDPIIVPLEKVSALDLGREFEDLSLAHGQMVWCTTQPTELASKLPPLISSKPLYGEAEFDRSYVDNKRGIRFSFVLDELDPIEKLFKTVGSDLNWGGNVVGHDHPRSIFNPREFLADYGRLYFDLNQDGDLTNDPPIEVMPTPPEWPHYKSVEVKETVFDYLSVPFDYGPSLGAQAFVLMPVFRQWTEGQAKLLLISPDARRGNVKIGNQSYTVILAQPCAISGRYDRPYTEMHLLPEGEAGMSGWWGSDQLCSVQMLDGCLRQFSTTPTGDKLTIQPYTGDMGIIRMGPGSRKLDPLTMRGSLFSRSCTAALGDIDPETNWPKYTSEAALPVGDYTFTVLYAHMGKLRLMVSNNCHADGVPHIREREIIYGIRIRKDKPFVLDFTNKPQVIFASPARDQVVHPGDEVTVQAVLIDPVLDLMIRHLHDTSRKEKKSLGGGRGTYETDVSLDPTVVVTDAAGKRVAEGVMPFG